MPPTAASSSFFLAADQNYFPYACLAALRAGELSAGPIDGYILHVGAAEADLSLARRLLDGRVGLVDAAELLGELAVRYDGRITKASYLRLFADLVPELAAYRRVVYLDCDVLLNRDPAQLAAIPFSTPLLAAHDLTAYYDLGYRDRLPVGPGAPYFNAGVLVFDLPTVRQAGLLEAGRRFAEDFPERCVQHDQDALNVAFEGQWRTLDPLWNAMTNLHWMPPFTETFARHFSGRKPWAKTPLGVEPEALAIYRRLAAGTPWATRFSPPPRLAGVTAAAKRLERTATGAFAQLSRNPRRLRRARFNAELAAIWRMLAEDAAAGRPARAFPERVFGLV